ncbi:hypothetical protein, partial [Arthrobacter sp. HMWF013]|uniref:hypothetical protein n=1 Tax=Arthrobacter sp. HMWF013 TaxID=2056849 RepID=UPI000D46F7A0
RRGPGLKPGNPGQPVQAIILPPAQRIRRKQHLTLGYVILGSVITVTATGTTKARGRGNGTASGNGTVSGYDGASDYGTASGGGHDALQHPIRRRTFHTPIIPPGTDNFGANKGLCG